MNTTLYSIAGILIPFLGTTVGSCFVLFLRKNLNEKIQKLIVGFAAGVMVAASVWSLILPSAELAGEQGVPRVDTASGWVYFRNNIFNNNKLCCR